MTFQPGDQVSFWWRGADGYLLAEKTGTVKSVGPRRIRVHVTDVEGCKADYFANVKPENLQLKDTD